jgi:glucose-6-phosphate isomerase
VAVAEPVADPVGGDRFTDVLTIGIGGSALGPKLHGAIAPSTRAAAR